MLLVFLFYYILFIYLILFYFILFYLFIFFFFFFFLGGWGNWYCFCCLELQFCPRFMLLILKVFIWQCLHTDFQYIYFRQTRCRTQSLLYIREFSKAYTHEGKEICIQMINVYSSIIHHGFDTLSAEPFKTRLYFLCFR